ncbi:MAG: TraB/GumN family protein [Spirochaetes bacterium]|nr:TraB/GumN family protein [Spirochaetota bacterium]
MYSKPKVEEIKQNVHLLTFPDKKKLYLVGTAHVSAASLELVSETIDEYKPDTVCIELDEQRYKSIMERNKYENIDIIEIIKKKQIFFFIGQFILASFQKKISDKTNSRPGEEFKEAIRKAEESQARLVLADRNVGTTLKRAWRLTPFWHKLKLFGAAFAAEDDEITEEKIEELKTSNAIDEMVNIFAKDLPITKNVMIDERDTYLVSEIQNNLGNVTVAVVGAGHVPGMLKKFEEFIPNEEKDKINFVPAPSFISKLIPWIIPGVIILGFLYGYFYGDRSYANDFFIYWVIINGSLSAIGCILALSHPLTVIAGFIAAPITSLNPTIGAGIVTGIVQTFLAKPRVTDFEEIQNGELGVLGWWRNRLTKIFLVFVLSSIGSMIGTFWAFKYLIKFING